MGMFDEVMVPCPECGERVAFQSKGGECTLAVYEMDNVPADVLSDVNRHAPMSCPRCDTAFSVRVAAVGYVERVREGLE